jgi:hypothetical protein
MSTPKKKPKPKPKRPTLKVGEDAVASTYDLDSLAATTGPADAALDAATFQKVQEESLAARGAETDSQNILDDLPGFVGSGLEIRQGLSEEQGKKLRLPEGYFALVVAYGLKLRALKVEHDQKSVDASAGKADREAVARRETIAGIAERDSVYDGLRNALGDGVTVKLDELVGTAETADKLSAGLSALAGFIEGVVKKGEKTDRLLLEQYSVGAACASALRERALRVQKAGAVKATPGRRVTQRALDVMDGRVLTLIEKGMRAFRAARRADPSILVPKLNRIAWMFETRRSGPKATKPPTGDVPAPTEGAPAPGSFEPEE